MLHLSARPARVSVVSLLAGLAALLGGCGGSEADGQALDEQTAPAAEAVQIWSDDLIRVVGSLEEAQQSFMIAGSAAGPHPIQAVEVLELQAEALSLMVTDLPGPPPTGDLLASRYSAFENTASELADASTLLGTAPPSGEPWNYGLLLASFENRRDHFLDECFGLQEVMADSELGVLGCVGLTGAEAEAQRVFDGQAEDGLFVSIDALSEIDAFIGTEPALGAAVVPRVSPTEYSECQSKQDQVQLDQLEDVAASVRMLLIEREQGDVFLEAWVFANNETADQVGAILQRMYETRRQCLEAFGPTGLVSNGSDGPGETSALTVSNLGGFETVDIDGLGEDVVHLQMAASAQQNLVAVYSAAGIAQPWPAEIIEELLNIAGLGGTRPLG